MFPHQFLVFHLPVLFSCSNWINAQDSEPMPVWPQIWSGKDVPEGKWPFMAEIRVNDSKSGHFCGAAVLNDDTMITAAHCIVMGKLTPDKVYIYLGQKKTDPVNKDSVYNVSKFIVHPRYNEKQNSYDIALIKLSRKIDFKKAKGRISKICIPSTDTEPDGSKCVAIGWGQTEPGKDTKGVLQEVNLPIIPCKKDEKRQSFFCAGYWDKPDGICYGDSGGPLVCPPKDNPNNTYLLYGLSSALFVVGCGKAPAGFTKVADYLDWIKQNAEA